MNVRFLILALAVMIFATWAPHQAQAQDQDRGVVLSNPCAGCHGPDGMSVSDIPNISGLDAKSIEAALKAFKSGEVRSTIMGRIAKGYSDQDIALIATALGKKQKASP